MGRNDIIEWKILITGLDSILETFKVGISPVDLISQPVQAHAITWCNGRFRRIADIPMSNSACQKLPCIHAVLKAATGPIGNWQVSGVLML